MTEFECICKEESASIIPSTSSEHQNVLPPDETVDASQTAQEPVVEETLKSRASKGTQKGHRCPICRSKGNEMYKMHRMHY